MLLGASRPWLGLGRRPAQGGATSAPTTPSYGARPDSTNTEFLTIPDASQTGLDFGTGDFSAAIWFYLDSTGAQVGLIGKKAASTDNSAGWVFRILSTGTLNVRIADGGGNGSCAHATTLSSGVLYLAIATFDRDGNCGISLNAGTEETTSIAAQSGSVSNANGFNIAAARDTGINPFDGGLVCAGVWNTLLDSTARTAIYNSGSPLLASALPGSVPTPVSYWNLDEQSDGSGAVTRNDSIGANHLTDTNTTPSSAFPFV